MLRKVILSALTLSLVFGMANSPFVFADTLENQVSNDSQTNTEELSTRGTIAEIQQDGRIYVVGSGSQEQIILDIEEAEIIDQTTGEPIGLDAIIKNEEVIVYYSPVMTKSMPPQGFAYRVLVNLTEELALENKAQSILAKATIINIEDEFLMAELESDNQEIRLITTETKVYDMVTGEHVNIDSISKGDKVLLNYGPNMTFSLPPQSNAIQIFVNADDEKAATLKMTAFKEVEKSEEHVSFLNINEDYIITFNQDTEITGPDGQTLKYSNINVGNGILVWSGIMTASFPGLATANKAVVITVDENAEIDLNNTSQNNESIEQKDEQQPIENAENNEITGNNIYVSPNRITLSATNKTGERGIEGSNLTIRHEGVLMLPVRSIAEAYGFEVTFNDEIREVQLIRGENFNIWSPIYEQPWVFEEYEGTVASFKVNTSSFEYFLSDTPVSLQDGNTFVIIDGKAYAPAEFFELVFEAKVAVAQIHD